jgi:hypothetical protein
MKYLFLYLLKVFTNGVVAILCVCFILLHFKVVVCMFLVDLIWHLQIQKSTVKAFNILIFTIKNPIKQIHIILNKIEDYDKARREIYRDYEESQ